MRLRTGSYVAFAAALAFAAPARADSPPLADFSAWSAGKPQSGLRRSTSTITTSDGKTHVYKVELAQTPRQHQIGMMYRKEMARDEGMLFLMGSPRPVGFFMRNTYIPLDIIFIAPDGKIRNIGAGMPLDETVIHSEGAVGAVLELRGGEAARIGLQPGDLVAWRPLQ